MNNQRPAKFFQLPSTAELYPAPQCHRRGIFGQLKHHETVFNSSAQKDLKWQGLNKKITNNSKEANHPSIEVTFLADFNLSENKNTKSKRYKAHFRHLAAPLIVLKFHVRSRSIDFNHLTSK